MKNKFYNFGLLSLAMIISFASTCFAQPPDPKIWEPLGNHSYYNKKIITKREGVLLVWTYKTVTADAGEKRMEEVRKYDLEKSIKYQNYHHEADLWEIDCTNRLIRMEEFIDFDKNGKVIDRYRYDPGEWLSVIPGSGVERLYQRVCLPRKNLPEKRK